MKSILHVSDCVRGSLIVIACLCFGYITGTCDPSVGLIVWAATIHHVAAYARVSTNDKGQNPDVQLAEIRTYVAQRGWTITKEYVDIISGTREHRPLLDRLLTDIRRGWITIIVVVRLDRLGRSLKHLVNLLAELGEHKVALISIKEGLDFSTSTGRLLFHVIGALAEFERDLIRERVKSGLIAQALKISRSAAHKILSTDKGQIPNI